MKELICLTSFSSIVANLSKVATLNKELIKKIPKMHQKVNKKKSCYDKY